MKKLSKFLCLGLVLMPLAASAQRDDQEPIKPTYNAGEDPVAEIKGPAARTVPREVRIDQLADSYSNFQDWFLNTSNWINDLQYHQEADTTDKMFGSGTDFYGYESNLGRARDEFSRYGGTIDVYIYQRRRDPNLSEAEREQLDLMSRRVNDIRGNLGELHYSAGRLGIVRDPAYARDIYSRQRELTTETQGYMRDLNRMMGETEWKAESEMKGPADRLNVTERNLNMREGEDNQSVERDIHHDTGHVDRQQRASDAIGEQLGDSDVDHSEMQHESHMEEHSESGAVGTPPSVH